MIPIITPVVVSNPYDTATLAWVRTVGTSFVSGARVGLVDKFIRGLKTDGVFTKFDRLWLFAAENQTSALIDIITNNRATAVNSPTFTTDRGYTGTSGTSGTLINSNYNATLNAINFSQNAASMSTWVVTSPGNIGNSNAGCTIGQISIQDTSLFIPLGSDGNVYARINSGSPSGSQGTPGSYLGHWFINRSGANATQLYQNGSSFSSPNDASGPPENINFSILAGQLASAFGFGGQLAMASIGGNLNSTDVSNFYSRLRTYMTAVGVP
jgi:hypothetical protein